MMMNQPVIDELLKSADSKYTVVIAVARRARQLNDGSDPFLEANSKKPVTVALHCVREPATYRMSMRRNLFLAPSQPCTERASRRFLNSLLEGGPAG